MTFNNQIQSQKDDIADAIKKVSGIPPKIREAIPKGKKGIGNFKSVSDFLVENTNEYNIEDIRSWFDGRSDSDSTILEPKFKPHNDVNTIDEYCNDIYYEDQSGVNRKDLSKDERDLIKKINGFGFGLTGISTFKDLYNSVDLWLYPGYGEYNDLLGVYKSDLKVGLFIDKIDQVAKDNDLLSFLGLDKDKFTSYLIGYVYIHELFHRYYDSFHEKAKKTYVPEIEEPMAELGALVSIEEMVSQKLFDKSFFKVAYQQVCAKRSSDKYYYYSLGSTLFDKGYGYGKELIEYYIRVSSLFDVNEDEVKKYKSCSRSNKKDLNGLADMLAKLIMSKKSNSTLQPTYNVKY